jgi:pimeloyl-ACP methyl ester carboxylesterase
MDIKHAYIEKGSGAPLILLHGNGESKEYFEYQIPFFSKDHRVIALDTRGHGKSPRGEMPFTISQFAEDLLGFMDERGIERAHLLGFSDGGNIAMTFAMRYPERVNRLILNGANLNAAGVKPLVQIPIEIGYHTAKLFAARSEEAKRNAEMLGLMVHYPKIGPEDLSRIRAKTLVIAGTKDMIRKSHTQLIARSIPDSRLVFIEGDHFIASKCAEEFNHAVLAFLKGEEP